MNYRLFNRHEIFNSDMMDIHFDLIRDIENYSYKMTGSFRGFRSLINMLHGIWDGFLYDELISESENSLSSDLVARVKEVVTFIESNGNLNSVTNV